MAFSNLSKAKEKKKDEFYTSFEDIEKELIHYEDKFKNKIVFCNCDDPFHSNFVKYFLINFNKNTQNSSASKQRESGGMNAL